MAHWFHRNPMKPTEFVKFELKGVLTTETCSKICVDLRLQREKVLSLFKNAGNNISEVDKEFSDYLRLFAGFLVDPMSVSDDIYSSQSSKLLPLVRFKWGHSMLGPVGTACKEGISEFQVASDLALKYATASGPGTRIKPEGHLFFRKIEPLLNRHLEKAERENGFIYHQKKWNETVYSAFDISKATMPDFSKIKKCKADLKPVHEEKIYQTEKDPSNSSGCVVS
uniref:BRO1 domain-containing protein n=1 Tax=Heterorhabditis bacteriophora TaxID=37862 RepID=A0A1I7XME8_HETBA